MGGVHVLRGRHAQLRWKSNRDLRRRKRTVRVTVEDGRLLAVGRGRRWWRHFTYPSEAELTVGDQTLAVWVRVADRPRPRFLFSREVALALESPEARPEAWRHRRRRATTPTIDLREVLDLRDEAPAPPAARATQGTSG